MKSGGTFRPIFQLIKVQECKDEALLLDLSCVNRRRHKEMFTLLLIYRPVHKQSDLIFCHLFLLEMVSDCHELFLRGETSSGVYTIQPVNAEPFKVFCEMTACELDQFDE